MQKKSCQLVHNTFWSTFVVLYHVFPVENMAKMNGKAPTIEKSTPVFTFSFPFTHLSIKTCAFLQIYFPKCLTSASFYLTCLNSPSLQVSLSLSYNIRQACSHCTQMTTTGIHYIFKCSQDNIWIRACKKINSCTNYLGSFINLNSILGLPPLICMCCDYCLVFYCANAFYFLHL